MPNAGSGLRSVGFIQRSHTFRARDAETTSPRGRCRRAAAEKLLAEEAAARPAASKAKKGKHKK